MKSTNATILMITTMFVIVTVASAAVDLSRALPSTESSNADEYAVSKDLAKVEKIPVMSNRELRRFIADRDANCDDCLERRHLVERALEVRGWLTGDERVTAQLTPLQQSAASHMQLHHITSVDPTQQQTINTELFLQNAVRTGVIQCTTPLANGTQYCAQVSNFM
jgi:hypothetical protein